ncbi:hypothetical protein HAX54_008682, partial [Datura stramonium]|nr:hypothetical protein [Datura stramonium]
TDGASRGNSGPSSIAFCIRDSEGYLKHAAARRIQDGSNFIAEVGAIRARLEYCLSNQLLPVVIEIDSLTMKKILNGTGSGDYCSDRISLQRDRGDDWSPAVMDQGINRRIRCNGFLTAIV